MLFRFGALRAPPRSRGRAVRSERYWRWTRRSARAVLTAEQRQNLFPPQSGARGVLLHQLVRALIPFIARIVGAEPRRRLLRLGRDAEREIAFGQAVARPGGVDRKSA